MAISTTNHVFKGHRTLLGGKKYVTYRELELPSGYDIHPVFKDGFDWGNGGKASQQLAFAILNQLTTKELAIKYTLTFTTSIIKNLNSRDWMLSASEVLEWIDANVEKEPTQSQPTMQKLEPPKNKPKAKPKHNKHSKKANVVKEICKELQITQKQLAEILEIPEGTVSSWAVKNEIPRLGKKAIEFYIEKSKNQKIIDSYKSFVELLKAS